MRVENFCEACASNLAKRTKVKGFDFTIFLPLVIEVLINTLGSCGRDDDDIIEMIEDGGFWTTYHIRKSVKEAAKMNKQNLPVSLKVVSDSILDEAQKAGSSEVKGMLQEVKENDPDFISVYS